MHIETVDDIVEELANFNDAYGAHVEEHPDGQCECRVCFTLGLADRIRAAVRNEEALAKAGLAGGK